MDCMKLVSEGSRGDNKQEFWEDILDKADTFKHVKRVTDQAPFTDMFEVTIEGKKAFYLVELPTW